MEGNDIESPEDEKPFTATPRAINRAVNVFDVPDDVIAEIGDAVRNVSVFELTVGEELMATRRAGGDSIRLAWELAHQSLAAVNGAAVSLVDGSSDKAWQALHPKLRQFVVTAYAKVHTPTEDQTRRFLQSRRIIMG